MKRILCCFALVFLLSLTSCDSSLSELGVTEKIIAVQYGTASENAVNEYLTEEFSYARYDSASDIVLAIENGKVNYGVLDDFQLCSFVNAQREIKSAEVCDYELKYCAYFSESNEMLRDSFNSAIHSLQENGTLDIIKNTYVNGKEYEFVSGKCENGTITMLCDPSFENRVYTNEEGEIVGLDVAVAKEICNILGYELEIVTADFDELFVMLDNGEGDFIITASEVTEERLEYYLCSESYFTLNFHLIERK